MDDEDGEKKGKNTHGSNSSPSMSTLTPTSTTSKSSSSTCKNESSSSTSSSSPEDSNVALLSCGTTIRISGAEDVVASAAAAAATPPRACSLRLRRSSISSAPLNLGTNTGFAGGASVAVETCCSCRGGDLDTIVAELAELVAVI